MCVRMDPTYLSTYSPIYPTYHLPASLLTTHLPTYLPTIQIVVAKPQKCMYCNECMVMAKNLKTTPEDDFVVTVKANEERFIFSVEVGQG